MQRKKRARRMKRSERSQFRYRRTEERQRSSSPKENDAEVGRVTKSCMTPSPRQAQGRPEKCKFFWRKRRVQTPYQLRNEAKETNDVGNKKFCLNRPEKHLSYHKFSGTAKGASRSGQTSGAVDAKPFPYEAGRGNWFSTIFFR
ncbi:UNVERIFIED_CONTAM: hypothetical protein HHA_285820 [Hammondia hammondi]|eukprot:XP_008884160.1 hypothetical protein HHA_285820 [Hammondia hammondi]